MPEEEPVTPPEAAPPAPDPVPHAEPEQPPVEAPADVPSGEVTPADNPKPTLDDLLEDALKDVTDGAKDVAQSAARALLEDGREVMKLLLSASDITDSDKRNLAKVYAGAEAQALNGNVRVSEQMMKRATNFLRTDAVIVKANKIEAAEMYLKNMLSIVSGLGGAFLNTIRVPLADKSTDIIGDLVQDILGDSPEDT